MFGDDASVSGECSLYVRCNVPVDSLVKSTPMIHLIFTEASSKPPVTFGTLTGTFVRVHATFICKYIQ